MIDYMLKIYSRSGHTRYYHNILEITFYEKSIRVKDDEGVILTIDIRNKFVEICAIESEE